jgi:hypothetical protein
MCTAAVMVNDMQYFLLSWTNEGFECVMDVTKYAPENWETEAMEARLSGVEFESPTRDLNSIINGLSMRAKFNSQRNHEVYMITGASGIDLDTVRELSETEPQFLADFARKNGHPIVKRIPQKKTVIE